MMDKYTELYEQSGAELKLLNEELIKLGADSILEEDESLDKFIEGVMADTEQLFEALSQPNLDIANELATEELRGLFEDLGLSDDFEGALIEEQVNEILNTDLEVLSEDSEEEEETESEVDDILNFELDEDDSEEEEEETLEEGFQSWIL